jgi:hypothetical protein
MNKKLGYYIVNGMEFDSKIKACIYANDTNQSVNWYFNNTVFENYPWHIEPEETLDQLYDIRARQLREEYDYIIVSYSGGADSHNLLMSFIRQGLFVDEILVNTMTKGNSKFMPIHEHNKTSNNAAASEHVVQTIPRLKEIYELCPNTKINIVDLTDFLFESFTNVGDASWVLKKREGLNPLNATRYNYLYFSDIRKRFDKDKKIALILGVEKPRTFIHTNDNFCIRFTDRSANVASVNDHIKEYPNATVEYFYWSPDSVRMLCKQAHVIKKWLEAFPVNQPLWHGKTMTKETFRLVHERVLRTILYTTWDDTWYQADKSTRDWYSEFDTWFISGQSGSRQHSIWLEGIKYVENKAAKFINKKNGIADGLEIFSHNYKIGPMTNKIIT